MEIISRIMPPNYEIIDTGDWHIGPLTSNIDGIKKMIKYVKNHKNVFVVLKGDLIDALSAEDKRYKHCTMDTKFLTVQAQYRYVQDLISEIRERVLFVQLGNHELVHLNDFDYAKEWSENLDIPYGGYSAKFIHLDRDGVPRFKQFYCHGSGSVNSSVESDIKRKAAIEDGIRKKLTKTLHSDVIYMSMAHLHKLVAIAPTIANELHLIDDGKKTKARYQTFEDQSAEYIPPNARWYGCSGSFLNTNAPGGVYMIPYAEVAMYGPLEHGYLKVIIKNDRMVDLQRIVL